jgi:AcrR family transcriptional regulator
MRVQVPRAEQVERNRRLVLDAARRVFLAKGYDGARLDGIAEEAGFSKGVVYSQFESKADLFLALLDERIEERAAQNERRAARKHGREAMRALLRHFDRDARDEAGWARVLVEFRARALRDPELNRRYAEAHRRSVERLADLIERVHADDDGELPASPFVIAQFIFALGAGLTLERGVDPGALPTDDILAIFERAIGGSES